jgi:hypothetical protein
LASDRFATVVALGCAACTGGADGSAQDIVLADSAGIQIVTVRGLDPADLPEWTLGADPAVEIGAVDAAQWLILSSTGAPVGRLSIGAGLEIEEVGRDYVLIRSTDADGVESIRLHSLSRG